MWMLLYWCCCFVSLSIVFFFFKQKTAYEMRISDWSSDVCSSDLMARTDPAEACPGNRLCRRHACARGGLQARGLPRYPDPDRRVGGIPGRLPVPILPA